MLILRCFCLVAKLCPTLLQPRGLLSGQTTLSMGFPRQEYWSGLPFPSSEDPSHPGIKPASPAVTRRFFIAEPPGKPFKTLGGNKIYCKAQEREHSQVFKYLMCLLVILKFGWFVFFNWLFNCLRQINWDNSAAWFHIYYWSVYVTITPSRHTQT